MGNRTSIGQKSPTFVGMQTLIIYELWASKDINRLEKSRRNMPDHFLCICSLVNFHLQCTFQIEANELLNECICSCLILVSESGGSSNTEVAHRSDSHSHYEAIPFPRITSSVNAGFSRLPL
jgi:hypothetical protein